MSNINLRSDKKVWNIVRIIVVALCAILFFACLFISRHRQSAMMFMAISLAVAAVTVFWYQVKSWLAAMWAKRAGRIVIKICIILLIIAFIYCVIISVFMLGAIGNAPQEDSTLIVLGCQVRGETPSLMLSRRIDAALNYLNENPSAVAVLSGGQGDGEWITEAEAIFRRLTENGISEDRLFLEELSTSTYENIAFSKAIIDENNLPHDVAIVTDGFHQYRAQFFAENEGLNPGAVRSRTPFYTEMYYWLREIAAITLQVIFGYW